MNRENGTVEISPVINAAALEPLFTPWEEPKYYRVRAEKKGAEVKVEQGRRPSPITIVQNLRFTIREWREAFYPGASDTSRQLLNYWFNRPHKITTSSGEEIDFRYYFCQREAMETLVYLKEARQIDSLSQLIEYFGGPDSEIAALGTTEEEDEWTRYAFKMATGSGKTKVMSLAIAWSYFHALRESDSPMARHFVVIAPNLTVYERLKDDFIDRDIFSQDPLIPPEWKGDWNFSVVLQDQVGGAVTGGVLYLTNIQRLYDTSKRKGRREAETYPWMGPPVSKATALDTGEKLRERVTSHDRILVLNDEAHHLWDPDNAWNEAIQFMHRTIKARTGGGIVAQLDFTATPKDNRGQLFKHTICDTPLGEAVDAGIVKTPIIGGSREKLTEEPSDNAAYRYDRHLRLGYERWKKSKEEWEKSGTKALMFVMCEDTKAADEIAERLNNEETFRELNNKTVNLHTNLKGKIKKIGRGPNAILKFVESDKEISEEDLRTLRELSRRLDDNTSPYNCIVSVLMLREGWDVRNVTTIVPLRPYTSKANILPEQTLGRGLRRITPPGPEQANELVTVVEHPAFASLYRQELAQEGLHIEMVDADRVPRTTITIYPDESRKDVSTLDIALPVLTAAYQIVPKLEGLTIDDVRKAFSKYRKLPLGSKTELEIEYEGRHLFTGEIIEKMRINLPLLSTGPGAVSYYVKQLEHICKIRGIHQVVAPLLQTFLEEILFESPASIYEPELLSRLGESDVAEHIRATFVPLILSRITKTKKRIAQKGKRRLSNWKPFQVTHSERHPVIEAKKTLFNLVPCNRELEVAFAQYADRAPDVVAFAKNAGPQCLRIDYIASNGNLSFYTPDFFVRTTEGVNYLVETKGRVDKDVSRKAKAAQQWCESASVAGISWRYLYIPQAVFEELTANTIEDLRRACEPALVKLLTEEEFEEKFPLLASLDQVEEELQDISDFVDDATLEALPSRYAKAVEQAVITFRFLKKKPDMDVTQAFTALLKSLDEACRGLILRRLEGDLPANVPDQKAWFTPYLDFADHGSRKHYQKMAQNLKKTLVFRNGISPIGLLRSCLDYALDKKLELGGVFEAVGKRFDDDGAPELLAIIQRVNDFRNTYVVHGSKELGDSEKAEEELRVWIQALSTITRY